MKGFTNSGIKDVTIEMKRYTNIKYDSIFFYTEVFLITENGFLYIQRKSEFKYWAQFYKKVLN